MQTTGTRQSDRVTLRVPIEASWQDSSGQIVAQAVETLLISRNGAVIKLAEKLAHGHELTLRRQVAQGEWKTARAAIVAEIDRDSTGFLVAIAMRDPSPDFWDIEFPALEEGRDALARMLMECSFCHGREIAYLNELELKSFEARNCVARLCKNCRAPSIWTEAHTEGRETGSQPAPARIAAVPEHVYPARQMHRVRTRVLACIRRRGFQEEVAVCEDLSRGGLAFRSRNQYPQGTRLEVAVPYTPGGSAIFVPIRIVSCRPISSAGLYRHGAAYLKSQSE